MFIALIAAFVGFVVFVGVSIFLLSGAQISQAWKIGLALLAEVMFFGGIRVAIGGIIATGGAW